MFKNCQVRTWGAGGCVYLSARKYVTFKYRNYNKEPTELVKTIATSNIYLFNDFSLDAIHYAVHKSWLMVIDEGRIALHQEHRELLEEMGNGYCLLLSSLPGQGAAMGLAEDQSQTVIALQSSHVTISKHSPTNANSYPR